MPAWLLKLSRYLSHLVVIEFGVVLKTLLGASTFAPLTHQDFFLAAFLAALAWLVVVLGLFDRTGVLPDVPPEERHPIGPPAPPAAPAEQVAALLVAQPPPSPRLRAMEAGRPSYGAETPANLAVTD